MLNFSCMSLKSLYLPKPLREKIMLSDDEFVRLFQERACLNPDGDRKSVV